MTLFRMEEGWGKILDNYDIAYILIEKDRLLVRLITSVGPAWQEVTQINKVCLISKIKLEVSQKSISGISSSFMPKNVS